MDLFIIAVLLVGLISGCKKGLFLQLASLVGAVVGFFIACYVYARYGDSLIPEGAGISTNVIIFLVLWIGIPLALTFVAKVLDRFMHALHIGWMNHLAGGVIGLLKMALFLSLIFTCLEFVSKYDKSPMVSQEVRESSVLYYPVQKLAGTLLPSDFLNRASDQVQLIKE